MGVGASDLSCNALAAAHARIIHGFLLDLRGVDANRPLHILELEAQSARFAYLVIQHLSARCQHLRPAPTMSFVYVLASDDATIARWRAHPWLVPLIEQGLLDFTVSKPRANTVPERTFESMVVIARHVFSNSPHDVFHVDRGQLYRRVRDHAAGATLRGWVYRPVQSAYQQERWNELLAGYAEQQERAIVSLCPSAMYWTEYVHRASRHGMLLCTDRVRLPTDHHGDESGLEPGDGAPTDDLEEYQGLDCHALLQFATLIGSTVLSPAQTSSPSTLLALIHRKGAGSITETIRAYEASTPTLASCTTWYTLAPLVERALPAADIEQLCAYLRATDWHDRALAQCAPYLLARIQAGGLSLDSRVSLRRSLEAIWRHYFPELWPDIQPAQAQDDSNQTRFDLAFTAGLLSFSIGYYELAQKFFTNSIELCGASAAGYYNLALCAAQLGQRYRALDYLDTALTLESGFQAARDMRLRVMGGM